jgi:hypothetical protein
MPDGNWGGTSGEEKLSVFIPLGPGSRLFSRNKRPCPKTNLVRLDPTGRIPNPPSPVPRHDFQPTTLPPGERRDGCAPLVKDATKPLLQIDNPDLAAAVSVASFSSPSPAMMGGIPLPQCNGIPLIQSGKR